MSQLSKYNKFWVALGAALAVTGAALSDGVLSTAEIVQIVVAFAGAAGVYMATNSAS